MQLQDRFRGSVLGLAAGDAVGTALEFEPPGSFRPITDMVGGGPFNLKRGEWTDDTSARGACRPTSRALDAAATIGFKKILLCNAIHGRFSR